MQKNILKKGLKLLGSAFFASYIALSKPVYAEEQNLMQEKQNISEKIQNDKPKNIEGIFAKDKLSFQIITGYFSSSACNIGPKSPEMNYTQTDLRIGKMLDKPTKWRFFPRGNLEALIELSSSDIYGRFGNYFIGATLLLRYNVVKPGWKIVPYVQIGLGLIYTDVYKDNSQDTIGNDINFTPQVSLGLRYLINEKLSIDAEAMFHHISSGSKVLNNTDRNHGLNSFGALIGVTFNF